MKLFICGYARHGKDTAAEILSRLFGLTFESSSHFCLRKFIRYELARDYGLTYATEEDCYDDRVNHRYKWFQLIANRNKEDPTRLTREIFTEYDIYVGIRNIDEFRLGLDLADLAIWIKDPRKPAESGCSNTIHEGDCDVTVLNNGTISDLELKLFRLFACRL